MPSSIKTQNLQLNQWLNNESPKRLDFVEDNKKIDDAFGEIKGKIENIDLSSTKVIRPNKKTVEESLITNETNLSNLKDKVDNGQNFKLTNDDGNYIKSDNANVDNILVGNHDIINAIGTIPSALDASDNNVIIECKSRDNLYVRQFCYDVRSIRSWERMRVNGVWCNWRSL